VEYKPDDFFVGLVDFFAILLPGALLAFLFTGTDQTTIFGNLLPPVRTPIEGWVIFLFAAYLLGQFISLIGATFMDWIYDHTYLPYRRRRGDLLYDRAKQLLSTNWEIAGLLKWTRAYVRLRSAGATKELDRLEATSKFFRSLFVVLLAYAASFICEFQWHALIVVLFLLVLSFWRFSNQRWKLTEYSYLFFIELMAYPEILGKG
jgi:hypothetical protein